MEFTPVTSMGRGIGRGRGVMTHASNPDGRVKQPDYSGALNMDKTSPMVRLKFPTRTATNSDIPEQSGGGTPKVNPRSSTPSTINNNSLEQLRDLLGELGTQIGEAVVSRIMGNQTLSPTTSPPLLIAPLSLGPPPSTLDMSRLNVVVKTDAKEPVMYRGDGTDKYTVQEWIDGVDVYLRKKSCPTEEQVDEVLSHLSGQAKNIVKVGLKSRADQVTHPEVIYDILRRYFSDCPMSSLPMADFYATRPDAEESPVDFWVRLNTAAEHADRHLQKSGSKMENMSAEIAMMFIRNCSSSDLSSVFKCKPISKWSAKEVQEAIDEHQREHPVRKRPTKPERPNIVTAAVAACSPVVEELTTNRAGVQEPPTPTKGSAVTAAEAGALERVLSMLEGVLTRAASPTQQPTQWTRPASCRVCGEKTHITREHCMKEKRCFGCLEPGHQKRDCTRASPHQTRPENHTLNQGN